MSDEDRRSWLTVNRPCGRCKKYFSYTFGDKDVKCPYCGWKLEDARKDKQDESER